MTRRLVFLAIVASLLAACGNKGPLVHPDPQPVDAPVDTPVDAPEQAPDTPPPAEPVDQS